MGSPPTLTLPRKGGGNKSPAVRLDLNSTHPPMPEPLDYKNAGLDLEKYAETLGRYERATSAATAP